MTIAGVEPCHFSPGAPATLEREAARYCTLGPVLTVDCNDPNVIQYFHDRALFPVVVETRASVAYTLKARGFTVYREWQSLIESSSCDIPYIFLGSGILEHTEHDILALIGSLCARPNPPQFVVLAYPTQKNRHAHLFAENLQQSLGLRYSITVGLHQNNPAMIFIRRKTQKICHVRWDGGQDSEIDGSLALVNKEFCDRLLGFSPPLLISSTSTRRPRLQNAEQTHFAQLTLPPDIVIRHSWPARFEPVHSRFTIHMQPWEYGALPTHWYAGLSSIDEIWAYTRYVANMYAESGFPRERIRVMPLGYDHHIFQPNQLPLDWTLKYLPEDTCIFSFVGGIIRRKGCDLAVQAFCRAFTQQDRVCLVIKTSGTDSFYARREELDVFGPLTTTSNAPNHLILNSYCSPAEIAALYRRSTALIAPFRGEGFGLPALEAMACGTPVIFSQGGAMDDFIPIEVGYPIAAERRPLHKNFVDGVQLIHDGWFLEPEVETIAHILREVYEDQQTARVKGQRAAQAVRNACTWDHAAQHARTRLTEISAMLGFAW